jgi:hypothetical protein
MSATAQALMHQIVYPALPAAGAPAAPSQPRVRETASVLISRILNPAALTTGTRSIRNR